VVAVLFVRQFLGTRHWPKIAILAAAAAYVVFMGVVIHDDVKDFRLVARNFYGRLGVFDDADPADDEEATRHLVHGVINHGEQALRPQYRRMPITYFCPSSGVGIAMRTLEGTPRRIGILGLGCGTLAAYGQPGDMMRIYEINPLVLQFARSEFTYLRDTAARTEVVLGDGRLSLEREPSQQFDLLVMDAFSGDSVPVHLITREAFRTYFRHLRPDGILAVNISNRYLDLRPVIERSAAAFGKIAMLFDYTPDEGDFLCFSCSWILVMDPATRPRLPAYAGQVLQAHVNFRPWTDDFSNMHRILK
jgi:SAM-dependent methyltransferase